MNRKLKRSGPHPPYAIVPLGSDGLACVFNLAGAGVLAMFPENTLTYFKELPDSTLLQEGRPYVFYVGEKIYLIGPLDRVEKGRIHFSQLYPVVLPGASLRTVDIVQVFEVDYRLVVTRDE